MIDPQNLEDVSDVHANDDNQTEVCKTPSAAERFFTVPNCLSLFRLALIPLIGWSLVTAQPLWLSVLLLLLSGGSDIADGQIARRCGQVTDVGKVLDPVADKLTQGCVLLCLALRYPILLQPLLVLLIREIVNSITGVMVIRSTGKVYGALWHGKATTVIVYALILIHIIWPQIPISVSSGLAAFSEIAMLISLCLYSKRNLELVRQGKADGKGGN